MTKTAFPPLHPLSGNAMKNYNYLCGVTNRVIALPKRGGEESPDSSGQCTG